MYPQVSSTQISKIDGGNFVPLLLKHKIKNKKAKLCFIFLKNPNNKNLSKKKKTLSNIFSSTSHHHLQLFPSPNSSTFFKH